MFIELHARHLVGHQAGYFVMNTGYYQQVNVVIAVFGREFSSLKSRIQVIKSWILDILSV